MAHRPYPNVDRSLRQVGRAADDVQLDEYRLSTRGGEHDFAYGDDHVRRCARCRLPHAQWAGGPCPGAPADWKPGSYV